jgi:two-component system, LytTR family, response regulator
LLPVCVYLVSDTKVHQESMCFSKMLIKKTILNVINAIIIDDEPGCVSNLMYYLSKYCPRINIVATGNSINDARDICRNTIFDIAFLDIEMGDGDVFALLTEGTVNKFEIIFVTAFESYALKAFKVQALDYILKPLMKSDIIECYRKITKRYTEVHSLDTIAENPDQSKLLLRQGDSIYVIKRADIYYLKANGVYTQMLFNYNGKQMSLIVSKPLGDLVQDYHTDLFYRVHKSYLINYRKVIEIVKGAVVQLKLENGLLIPVAKRRVHDFLIFFNSNK